MSSRHIVRRAADASPIVPEELAGRSDGFRRWSAVDETVGAVHTGFGICDLDPGGRVATHVHSFE